MMEVLRVMPPMQKFPTSGGSLPAVHRFVIDRAESIVARSALAGAHTTLVFRRPDGVRRWRRR